MKNDPRSYARNFYNCVKKPEKKIIIKRPINRVIAESHNNGYRRQVISRYGHGQEMSRNCESVCTLIGVVRRNDSAQDSE